MSLSVCRRYCAWMARSFQHMRNTRSRPRRITHNTAQNKQARQAQEQAMYEAVQPYEEHASLDEVPDPGSGFRLIEKCVLCVWGGGVYIHIF